MKTFFTYLLGAVIVIALLLAGISLFERFGAENGKQPDAQESTVEPHNYFYEKTGAEGQRSFVTTATVTQNDSAVMILKIKVPEGYSTCIWRKDLKQGRWYQGETSHGTFDLKLDERTGIYTGTSKFANGKDSESWCLIPQR